MTETITEIKKSTRHYTIENNKMKNYQMESYLFLSYNKFGYFVVAVPYERTSSLINYLWL